MLNVWSAGFCHDYYFILGGAGLLLLFAVEGTLQLRVYVMYDCSVKLLVINGSLFVIEMGLMISFYLLDTAKTTSKLAVPSTALEEADEVITSH